MMIHFFKYHGAGNDFIMIDQRTEATFQRADTAIVAQLCHRRFGIGADGLILLQNHPEFGTEMVYFNADGNESTFCGNGGRCFTAFANHLGIADGHFSFLATDGPHEALITSNKNANGLEWVELKMKDVSAIEDFDASSFVLHTGSPHFVQFAENIADVDMVKAGRAIRYSDRFKSEGINVNLVALEGDGLRIRTYERGVEDETLACGTGVTAAALSLARLKGFTGDHEIGVAALGGQLSVRFTVQPDGSFANIWLCGPAQRVFEGTIIKTQYEK